jgi:hypothetical protein
MSIIHKVSNKLYDFASDLVGNRVLDLYLKYNGIKMLNTATLVPIALILGKNAFENIVMEQRGGNLKIPDDLPVIDDPLVGSYFKLAGIPALAAITPQTLVPLGVLMLLYNLYETGQLGIFSDDLSSSFTGRQSGGSELMKYIKNLWGNRVLDLFVKYQGLKTLTSATLVPFALLLGRDALEEVLSNKQRGGSRLTIPDDMPVLDDPLVGNYLKLAGIGSLSIAPNTLIPLGLAALLYHIYLE